MEYITLPQTNLKVSKIILGCMRISDKSINEIETLVKKALDLGINFFDHADIYGNGKSEEKFGEVLKRNPHLRKDMIIQSKCGIVPGKYYDLSKKHIKESVNQSLQRLNTSYLDILLLHRPDALADPKEIAEAFNELYNEGKVKYFGVSNYNSYQIKLLQKYLDKPIIINQLQLSIIHSSMLDQGIFVNMNDSHANNKDGSILDYCRINDITIQPWSSLQASWEDGTFIDNDKYAKLNKCLDKLSKEYNVTKSAIAISFLLRHPASFTPIIGTTSTKHLEEIVKAIDIHLTREQWYTLYLANNKILP